MKVKDLMHGKRYRYTTKANDVFEGTFEQNPIVAEGRFLTKLTKKPHWWSEDWISIVDSPNIEARLEEID